MKGSTQLGQSIVRVYSCLITYLISSFFSTIGTPSCKEWSPEIPISHNHFKVVPPRSWIDILPRISQDAQDLLSVSIYVHVQCII